MKFRFFLFLWLFPVFASSQENSAQPVCMVKTSVKQMWVDRLNRIYAVNNQGLFQYNPSCVLTASFTKKITGGISSVDVSNPLKILVFSQAEQSLYLLNDRLHVQSVISLSDLGIMQAVVVCNSRGDGFRVYDGATHKLKRFDFKLNLLQENEINDLAEFSFDPVLMAENEKFIAIGNRNSEIIVFDRFGNYINAFSSDAPDRFYLTDSDIVYNENDKLVFISPDRPDNYRTEPFSVSGRDAIKINNRWIFYDSTGFEVFEN